MSASPCLIDASSMLEATRRPGSGMLLNSSPFQLDEMVTQWEPWSVDNGPKEHRHGQDRPID